MILDKNRLYRGANCSDALVSISLSIRQLFARSMSFEEKWYSPEDYFYLMNREEDLEYKVFDL
jgi:hypothetical protein